MGDRLRFVIWLSALHLGTWTTKEFAAAVGKADAQFPRWAREDPRPDWSTIKDIAAAVGVSPSWLDDPRNPEAQQPELFVQWLEARRRFATRPPIATGFKKLSSKELAAEKKKASDAKGKKA